MNDDDVAPIIVDPNGQPARRRLKDEKRCPRCGAPEEKRVPSSGFGTPHQICSECGFEFAE